MVAHELSHIRNYDILISTLAVTMVGAVALLSDMAIRMMWWNGGRVPPRGRPRRSRQPAGDRRVRAADPRPDHRQGDAGGDLPSARDAGRRERLSDDALSAWTDLSARKTPGRYDGDAFCVHGYGTLVDRATDERGGRQRSPRRTSPVVRHPPTARRAHRTAERTVNRTRPVIALPSSLAGLRSSPPVGGGDDDESAETTRRPRRSPRRRRPPARAPRPRRPPTAPPTLPIDHGAAGVDHDRSRRAPHAAHR